MGGFFVQKSGMVALGLPPKIPKSSPKSTPQISKSSPRANIQNKDF